MDDKMAKSRTWRMLSNISRDLAIHSVCAASWSASVSRVVSELEQLVEQELTTMPLSGLDLRPLLSPFSVLSFLPPLLAGLHVLIGASAPRPSFCSGWKSGTFVGNDTCRSSLTICLSYTALRRVKISLLYSQSGKTNSSNQSNMQQTWNRSRKHGAEAIFSD